MRAKEVGSGQQLTRSFMLSFHAGWVVFPNLSLFAVDAPVLGSN